MRGWMLVVAMAGCVEAPKVDYQKKIDAWQQTPTDEVDILWVVDNSNSMQLEQSLLAAGFSSFANELEETNTDFHLGVITTDFDYDDPERGRLIGSPSVITREDPSYVEAFQTRAQVGLNGSGKEKGLEAAEYALSPSMTIAGSPNAGFLRTDANLLVVIVSDEDDCSDKGALANEDSEACYTEREKLFPTGTFVNAFRDLKASPDQVRVSAIVGPADATAICDQSTVEGTRYIEVARLTGGLSGSICETDWSDMLYELGLNAAGIIFTFELSHGAVAGTLVVYVNDLVVPESEFDGYTYDAEAESITFHGTWIPQRGAEIRAEYSIEPGT
jgi:hypothetical protein